MNKNCLQMWQAFKHHKHERFGHNSSVDSAWELTEASKDRKSGTSD